MTQKSIPAFTLPGIYRTEPQPVTGYRAEREHFAALASADRPRRRFRFARLFG